MQYPRLSNAWRPLGSSDKPYELSSEESAISQGLRLGLYSICIYEGLLLTEYIAFAPVFAEHCALASHDLRAIVLGTLGAFGGLSFVQPLFKASSPGRSAVANGASFFGGLLILPLSRELSDLLANSLTSYSVNFDAWWARSVLACLTVPLTSALGWRLLSSYAPLRLI